VDRLKSIWVAGTNITVIPTYPLFDNADEFFLDTESVQTSQVFAPYNKTHVNSL